MVGMTKEELLKRTFVRFLLNKKFVNSDFENIWLLFIGKRTNLDTEENFQCIYSFFKESLEKEYFILNTTTFPYSYSSAYTEHQLIKLNLPMELQSPYESIYQKYQKLKKDFYQTEIEIEYLQECFKEFPEIQFHIESLIYKKEQEHFKLESRINILNEIIKTLT